MTKGPRGQTHLADAIGYTIKATLLARGWGKAGARPRADKLTAAERSAVAKKVAAARWK